MKVGAVIRKDFLQLFFVILSFTLMVVVSYHYVSGIVEKQIFSKVQESINTAEEIIHSDFREAEAVLFDAGLTIEKWLDFGANADDIQSYLSSMSRSLRSGNERLEGYVDLFCLINGEFISGGEPRLGSAAGSGNGFTPSRSFLPYNKDWYTVAKEAGNEIAVTLPYYNEENDKLVVSLYKTLRDKNEVDIGVLVLNMDFRVISDYVESLYANDSGYGMLADKDFTFIVHPIPEFLNRSMDETSPGHARTAEQFREDKDTVVIQRFMNRRGVQMVLVIKKIYNGWYLGIAIPVNAYYRDVKQMSFALSGLGISFMIILSLILIQLSLSKARSEEENKEKSSFLARMSHEIRTPMNSILGMAELIQRKAISNDILEYIEIINQSGTNLLAIINDILDFSKIESGRLQIQNRNYFISSVINDMINITRPEVAEKSLDFFVNVDSNIPAQLFGDDMRLRQILTNLLSNAVKYTRRGFISMNVEMEHQADNSLKLIFSVQDSGIGIKPEDQKKLFSEFARMDIKENLGIEGTGLGLVITRALCRAMGGDVTGTSEYGRGSVFRAEIIQDYIDHKPVAAVINPGKKRVLFYDWRPQYVISIANTLKGLGIGFNCSAVFHEFLSDLEYGNYDYAFISSKYAMDCIYALGRRVNPLQLVIMVEPGEVAVYREVISILMPVYSITMANILNDAAEGSMLHDKNLKIHFTAPGAKVLIVDDISTNLRVAKELMAPYNMTVHTCLSGSEALNLAKSNYYDLIFMDHMMPGMDGIEATSFIRSLESGDGYFQQLPIVALTANALSGQREMFIENGINDFLAKPIDIQKLDEILEKWLPSEKRVEATHTQPVDPKLAKTDFIHIPGIDVSLGLNNCGGGATVYLNILEDFCKDAESRLVQINEALEARNFKLYTTLVHAIKGAARSIGAVETGEKASWLEKASTQEDLSAILDKTSGLMEDIRILINNIRSVLEKHEIDDLRERTNVSGLRLDSLKKALIDMNIEDVNKILLDFTNLFLDTKTKAIIAEVEQHILMFEYEKAIEKINKFL